MDNIIQLFSGSFVDVVSRIFEVLLSNWHIWIPVLAAWMMGFMCTRWLNLNNIRRKAEREWFVYKVNLSVAFFAYILFNFKLSIDVLQQATLAASVSVLLPAVVFWYKNYKFKKENDS